MSDAVRELVIKVTRDDAEAKAKAAAYWAAELEGQKKAATAAKATGAAVSAAGKAAADDAKAAERQKVAERKKAAKEIIDSVKAQVAESKRLEREAFAEGRRLAREAATADRKSAAEARGYTRAALAEHKSAQKEKADASKQAARSILESVKAQIDESRRIEKQAFAEGRRLASDAAAADRKAAAEARTYSRAAWREASQRYRDQRKSVDEAAAATQRLTRVMLGSQVAGSALSLVKTSFDSINRSVQAATSHLRDLIQKGEEARKLDREIAALTGNAPTILYSAQQAREAAQAGVSPDDYRRGQLAFQAQAGQFIGEGEFSKISQEDAANLMQRVASFSASQGIDVADPARLMGTLIGKAPAGTSNADLMGTFGKLFKAIQLAPGETSPLVGQLAELVQEEVGNGGTFQDVLDAAPLIRAMAERNPGEASTYGRSILRGLREVRSDPQKMKELGITSGMGFMEQVQAVDSASQKYAAGGGDEGEFLSRYFKDIRTFGGVRTAINAGVRGKGFERVYAEMNGVSGDTIDSAIANYLLSEEGMTQRQESSVAAAEREQASRQVPYQRTRRTAREALISSGELGRDEGLIGSLLTGAAEAAGYGTREEQELRKIVGQTIYGKLSTIPGGREYMRNAGIDPVANGASGSLGSGNIPESSLIDAAAMFEQLKRALEANTKAIERSAPNAPRRLPDPAPAKLGNPY